MNSKRVLIVDDDEFVLFLVKTFTQQLLPGCQIVTVRNSVSALVELQQQSFDLVMIDYQAPQINGLDLARAIWKINPAIPIMLMTGNHCCYKLQPETESVSPNNFVVRPFSILQLENILQRNGV